MSGLRVIARGGGGGGVELCDGTCGGGKFTGLVRCFFGIGTVGSVPLDCLAQAVIKVGVAVPTQFALGATGVDTSARLAIGASWVPYR